MSIDKNEWNESLFGCMSDCGSCWYGCLCTPCLFGSNAKKIDDSNCVCMCLAYSCLSECCLGWILHYMKRKSLRDKYNLREDPSCGDCLTTFCCSPCALCQEARFLKAQNAKKILASPYVYVIQPTSYNGKW